MTKIIFVVGSPRSGTTYLSRALGLADHAAYLGESALFCLSAIRIDRDFYARNMVPSDLFPYNRPAMFLLNGLDDIRRKDRVRDAVEHMLRMSKVSEYDLAPSNPLYEVAGVELDKTECNDLGTLSSRLRFLLEKEGLAAYARAYIDEYAHRRACDTVVEKTPLHLRCLPVLHAVFPAAKVVLIRRDKEDCLRSFVRTFGKGPGINRFLSEREAQRKVHRELLEDIDREEWAARQPWIKSVEFNDFVQQPQAVLETLSRWLELDFNFTREDLVFPSYKRK